MNPSLYSTEKCRQPHGNRGPKRQVHARKEMKQKQPLLVFPQRDWEDGFPRVGVAVAFLQGDALLPSKATKAKSAAHSAMVHTLLYAGGKIPLFFLNFLGPSKFPMSGNFAIRWEISLNKFSWIRAPSGKGTTLLNTKEEKPQLPEAVCGKECQPH